MRYWLFKSEPEVYGIEDLKSAEGQTDHWDGVRNYQARNFIRDDMREGDRVLFYHSRCDVPGVAGVAEIVRKGYPDFTAWDPKAPYFDAKTDPENPRWYMVDIRYIEAFPQVVALKTLRTLESLEGMKLLQRGQRLSIQPVEKHEFDIILELGRGTSA